MRGTINHLDLTVTDLERARPFYEAVLGFMGYRPNHLTERSFDFDLTEPRGTFCSIGIVKAKGEGAARKHDRLSPGLHHVAWNATDRADVDRFHELLRSIGATILDAPADYPQYGPGYYAVFFADPDGLKLEYVYWPK